VADKGGKKRKSATSATKETPLILDQFTTADLRAWQRVSDSLEEFHVRLYYHLEGLRKVHQQEIIESLQAATPLSKEIERWARIIDYKYSLEPLSAMGSLILGGRFNIGNNINPSEFPPFSALYIAENYPTAYAEKFGILDTGERDGLSGFELALRKPSSFTSINISGRLNNLFDISNGRNFAKFLEIIKRFKMPYELKELAKKVRVKPPYLVTNFPLMKRALLATDWQAMPAQYQIPANPQIFGRLIRDAGYEGIIYPSVRGHGKCVALFPENFSGSDSYLELSDEPPDGTICGRLDSQTWRDLIV
jgi:hypothetical protein